ncbi:hypothetical protein O6H91_13G046300 [Diphasiastrum complanatum]|uniref:Uncharacterized protein n=3 Tax=Diphasiastrum complanatum TaxID=34168 RepID=A0ACC2BUB0_DIPCM|nr:hypothetical protein O6H91_13G046300 [Diphasiastrum complanatum]KAJ7533385.1 hypothetical protein O6H91_13G046300 [Diphasiastrum complanatum]KAJ7533386.1 hypothetical protein O6H91_13G046300 [Diphasiastrum complanatum]
MMNIKLKKLISRKPAKSETNEAPMFGAASSSASIELITGLGVSESGKGGSKSSVSASVARSSVLTSNSSASGRQPPAVREKPQAFPLSSNGNPNGCFESLPSMRDVPSSDRQSLFVRKLRLCCYVVDSTDPNKMVREKEIKRKTLLELVDYATSGTCKFSEAVMDDIITMLKANLFRSLPLSSRESSGTSDCADPEEEQPSIMDPAWPHLQIVYEFLLRFVVSTETDPKVARKYIDQPFLMQLLNLFDSEDPREREYLKTILHRIYGKFMVHRTFIRKGINDIFYQFVFEVEKQNGIAELLEILGSIINGFAVPLKEEHKLFLVQALIPLHKPKCLVFYHQQLSYCITQYVEKDSQLAGTVIRGLLKYWPVTNSQKEVLFLGELEDVLEGTQAAEFQRCIDFLFQKIARCLNSSHFQVAERALFLWSNDHFVNLMAQNREAILPIIFAALEKNIGSHWNQTVRVLTLNVRNMFLEMDPELFNRCLQKFNQDEKKLKTSKENREITWQQVEALAASRSTISDRALVAASSSIQA